MLIKLLTPGHIPLSKGICTITGWIRGGSLAIESPGAHTRGWILEVSEEELQGLQENDFFYLCSNGDLMLRGIGIDMTLSTKKFASLARISESMAWKQLTHLTSQGFLKSTRVGRELKFMVNHGT